MSLKRRSTGFTLIEIMIAVAIMGVLVALAVAAWDKLGTRAGPRDAARTLQGALSAARARALDHNTREWVIIYPDVDANGQSGSGGHGAFFVVDDPDLSFQSNGYGDFNPASPQVVGATWHVMSQDFLDNYPKKNVHFGVDITPAPTYPPPFDTIPPVIPPVACGFCNGSPPHGAIVFQGTGVAWFVNADGTFTANGTSESGASVPDSTAAARAGIFALASPNDGGANMAYLFAVSGPTGFVGFYSKP